MPKRRRTFPGGDEAPAAVPARGRAPMNLAFSMRGMIINGIFPPADAPCSPE
jgi:hypothetical protein